MIELFEGRSVMELKSAIRGYLECHGEVEVVTISHCNVSSTGPLGGFNLWNALVVFRKKA